MGGTVYGMGGSVYGKKMDMPALHFVINPKNGDPFDQKSQQLQGWLKNVDELSKEQQACLPHMMHLFMEEALQDFKTRNVYASRHGIINNSVKDGKQALEIVKALTPSSDNIHVMRALKIAAEEAYDAGRDAGQEDTNSYYHKMEYKNGFNEGLRQGKIKGALTVAALSTVVALGFLFSKNNKDTTQPVKPKTESVQPITISSVKATSLNL